MIVLSPEVAPNWDSGRGVGIPFCTDECPSHDGKRCLVLGFRPMGLCEPAVIAMNEEIGRQVKALDAYRKALRKESIDRADGGFLCGRCFWSWSDGQPESHAPGCLCTPEGPRP